MDSDLKELVDRLQKAYGERLVAIILYGSAAAGDRQANYSDYNIFCILPRITPTELAAAETIFRWWREKGNPAPLLMGEHELRRSTDCFPIEFHDMHERRQVLYG